MASIFGNPRKGRLKHWKKQSSNWRISPLMNLVLVSETAPGSHDPRGGHESSSHGICRWFSKIEVVSGVLLAEVLEGADYTSNYATGPRLALWYNLILTQTKHVRQGRHLVERVLLIDLRLLETSKIVPDKMVLFPLLREWEVEWEPPLSIFILSPSSSSSKGRSEMIWGNQKWFLCHILLMCCLPSWYEAGDSPSWINS